MKTLFQLLLLVPAINHHPAPQSVIEHRFDVRGFDRIELSGCDRVVIVPGESFEVAAHGSATALEATSVGLLDTTLRIRPLHNRCALPEGGNQKVTITITMPTLAGVSVDGAGSIEARDITSSEFFAEGSGGGALRISGLCADAGRIRLSGGSHAILDEASLGQLSLEVGGAGSITVKGTSRAVEVDAEGAAHVDTGELSTPLLKISADGAAVIRSMTSGPAMIEAAGASDVAVEGQPTCEIRRSGTAKVACS